MIHYTLPEHAYTTSSIIKVTYHPVRKITHIHYVNTMSPHIYNHQMMQNIHGLYAEDKEYILTESRRIALKYLLTGDIDDFDYPF